MKTTVVMLLSLAGVVLLVPLLFVAQNLVGAPVDAANWRLDERYPRTTETNELHLIVQEREGGSGGASARDRALPAVVGYSSDAVAITIPMKHLGNGIMLESSFPVVVRLNAPIGNRSIEHLRGGSLVDDLSSFSEPPLDLTPTT